MRSSESTTGTPELNIIYLSQDHMIDHPAGAHYALWNGPGFLDIGLPSGDFVRFSVATLTSQWTLLMDAQSRPLPVAARYDDRNLAIWWLPYDGPGASTATHAGSAMKDTDYAAALQKLSSTRYQALMDAAWGIGGWSTYRRR
jgi:hypothetical protein